MNSQILRDACRNLNFLTCGNFCLNSCSASMANPGPPSSAHRSTVAWLAGVGWMRFCCMVQRSHLDTSVRLHA